VTTLGLHLSLGRTVAFCPRCQLVCDWVQQPGLAYPVLWDTAVCKTCFHPIEVISARGGSLPAVAT